MHSKPNAFPVERKGPLEQSWYVQSLCKQTASPSVRKTIAFICKAT